MKKKHLQKPPVLLYLPVSKFHFYSDTSDFATGSILYQIKNGQLVLIANASKRMSAAAQNYSITELELCWLAINISSFSHLLKRVDFDAIGDHLVLTHIIEGFHKGSRLMYFAVIARLSSGHNKEFLKVVKIISYLDAFSLNDGSSTKSCKILECSRKEALSLS